MHEFQLEMNPNLLCVHGECVRETAGRPASRPAVDLKCGVIRCVLQRDYRKPTHVLCNLNL